MRPESKRWLEQAQYDLETAQGNLEIRKYYASAFFSQQAAEKALKALAIEKTRELPKTHSLIELGNILKIKDDDLIELTPEYTLTRYPDAANEVPAKIYNAKIAREKLDAAQRILAKVKQWMPT